MSLRSSSTPAVPPATGENPVRRRGVGLVRLQYDGLGNVTRRVWRKPNGGLVRQQDFTWDAFNRLVKVSERDANTNGFDWKAGFDPLGRRLRVSEQYVLTNISSGSVSTTESYYDPHVEFLELLVNYNGRMELKVYGPDVSGTYGGAQGIGGLEAIIDTAGTNKHTVLNDRFGNVLGSAPVGQSNAFQWVAARFTSYGPKVGYETPFLASAVSLVQALGWQGQRRDLTGLYYWNARPYDPVERRFLSPDPLGATATPALYPAFGGDPVNWFDPEGRDVLPQISGFTYDPGSGRVLEVQHAVPGQGIACGPTHLEWLGTWPHSWNQTIYPFDYNWQAQGLINDLRAYNTAHPPPAAPWQPDPGRITSADMDFLNAATIVLGTRVAGGLAEAAYGRFTGAMQARVQTTAGQVLADPAFAQRAMAEGFAPDQISGLQQAVTSGDLTVEASWNPIQSAVPGRVSLNPFASDQVMGHEFGHALQYSANPALRGAELSGELSWSDVFGIERQANLIGYGTPRPFSAGLNATYNAEHLQTQRLI